MIVLQDDGKGMDPVMLRNKALQGPDQRTPGADLGRGLQLVFLPGFSTKEVASSVSGRGVAWTW
jgi:two-component system chemotaxis sensor kinase CheA